jgi:hypothetical protein
MGAVLGCALVCEHCAFDVMPRFVEATTKTLRFVECTLPGFNGARMRAEGIVSFYRSTVDTVLRLDRATVAGEICLRDLTYEALEPQLPARQRLAWLARDRGDHRRQPYEQLAALYTKIGQPAQARRVLYAAERLQRTAMSAPGRAWSLIQDITVGYGYRPLRAALWFAAFLVIGSVTYAASPPPPLSASGGPHFNPVIYTLDLLLPVVDLGQKHAFNPAVSTHVARGRSRRTGCGPRWQAGQVRPNPRVTGSAIRGYSARPGTPISFRVMENGEPDFGRPSWMPPDDVLPAIVPIGRFLMRAERMIVALSHLSVYRNGCMLDVRANARGHDVAFDVFEHMVFAARFGAENIAVMWDKTAPRWRPDGKPALVLMQYGHEGGHSGLGTEDRRVHSTLRLWLYPLPPPEPGTLSIVSPSLVPSPANCPLDGPAIVAAATRAQPYWP